jgi:ribosomal protein S18 acetylase RimI-like enzyme
LQFKTYNNLTKVQKEIVISIFHETSAVKSFKTEKLKEEFEYKYIGYYYLNHPELFLVALSGEGVPLGYICGVIDTLSCTSLFDLVPSLSLFKAELDEFPSHLHINCTAHSRGMGVGSKLMREFLAKLRMSNSRGVHIVTIPDSDNVRFYAKHFFTFEKQKIKGGNRLLFMAKAL